MKHLKYLKLFEHYVNKYDFEVGHRYQYNDLPEPTRYDIEVQFDTAPMSDPGPEDYEYEFQLLSPEESEEHLFKHFGEFNISDKLDEPFMKKLIKSIKDGGLDYPSVGEEGNHRALAYWHLKKDLPYLEFIPKEIKY